MRRSLIVVILLSAAASAQIRGVPPSVTSITTGPDGSPIFRGVPSSVMSLGPEGFGPPLPSPRFSRRALPVFFPAFVPIPYVLIERERIVEREIRTEVAREDEEFDRERSRSRRMRERDDDETSHAEIAEAQEPEPPRVARAPAPEPPADIARTLLVFRDGSRAQVRNFAILGDSLFVFAPDPSRKVLLAELDLDATRTANEARGQTFVLPE